ncbi:hypothetical protein [Luteolibacter luteus]|uniref:Uncharacterized protein n=1 Tax=Luteolibacter luteus TaxID=2728835 RepID=A0A858RRM8_9BACT|nr:hypothetical protein [Luteolibacter luteus]QJE98790.1 hypothetical protein HHL09_24425 [Luteolibacter luteus]
MNITRSAVIIGVLHLFLFAGMLWVSFAAERRWHLIRDDLVVLGLLTRPIQYLAFSTGWLCFCLLIFLSLLAMLWKSGRGLVVLLVVDGIFVLLLLVFGFQVALLELPVLPLKDKIRYIFSD